MHLILEHPEIAYRDCGHCQTYIYTEHGEVQKHLGEPLKWPKGAGPACTTSKGCPKGSPDGDIELTEQNAMAYLHYLECRAVGSFPDDGIVRHNARIIRGVEDLMRDMRQQIIVELVKAQMVK